MLVCGKVIAARAPVGKAGDTDAPSHPTSGSVGGGDQVSLDRRGPLRLALARLPGTLATHWRQNRPCQEPAALNRDRTLPRYLGPTESELHLSVANLLDWVLLPPAFYSTFPAGWGVLSPSMAQRLKRSGLKAGMPDMMVFYDGRCFGIELEARKNGLSSEQVITFKKLKEACIRVHVCRSIDDVMHALRYEDVPLRRMYIGDADGTASREAG